MKEIARYGKFGVRESETLLGVSYLEVVKYYPNHYYNRYKDYTFDEQEGMFVSNTDNSIKVSPVCFVSKECCFSLVTLDWGQSDEPDFKSVGLRPITEVSIEEYPDFNTAVKDMYNYYNANQRYAETT